MLGADILVRILADYGVETMFGVPGDTNVPLYTALQRQTGTIRHVMCRDERSAGFMAEAYARISNRVGVVESPSGAGAMYTMPGVAEAFGSSVAMILLTIDIPLKGEGRGVLTELDCVKLFEPVTKASMQIKSADKIAEIMRRAFRVATTGKPGAVQVVVPEDMLLAEVPESEFSLHVEEGCKRFPAYPGLPDPALLEALLTMVAEAERPLIVAGAGINRSGARAALKSFAEAANIPVVNSITGQGALPDDHRLAIGVIGDNGFHPHANRAMEEADLLIYFGSRNGSVVSVAWSFPSPAPRRIAQIDVDPAMLANMSENDLSISGDARLVLEALSRQIAGIPLKPDAWVDRINAWRDTFWQEAESLFEDIGAPLRPEPVVRAMAARLPHPVNIVADAGTPTPYMTRFLRIADAASNFIIPRAYGGLGYAIPGAVGAWLAEPEKRPIAMFGDGSFAMSMGELETLARLRCPAVLLHFNNACFGWIKGLHRLQGKGANDCYSVDFSPMNAAKVAEAMGLAAWRVETVAEFEAAFEAALAHDGPSFIDILVESVSDRVPPVVSWLRKAGRDPLAVAGGERVPYGN